MQASHNQLEEKVKLLEHENAELKSSTSKIQSETKRVTEELTNDKVCQICFTHPKNALIQPCNHLMTCMECSTKIYSKRKKDERVCPICRGPIQSVLLCHLWGDTEESQQDETCGLN